MTETVITIPDADTLVQQAKDLSLSIKQEYATPRTCLRMLQADIKGELDRMASSLEIECSKALDLLQDEEASNALDPG